MNKKKIISIVVLSLLALLLVGGIVGLVVWRMSMETIAKAENTYHAQYDSYCTYESDENISIDGELDEAEWQGKKWFSNTYLENVKGELPVMKITGFTTERGVYLASTVTDTNLINDGQRSKTNTLWQLNVAATSTGGKMKTDGMKTYTFYVDMAEQSYAWYSNFDRAVKVDGELNSGKTKGATLEMFIPWQMLDINPEEGVPTQFYLLPIYYGIFEGETNRTLMTTINQPHISNVSEYFVFDNTGYTNADREGAILGDTKFGAAKTSNWDVSKEKDGIVSSSIGTEHHKIFFKEEYGENFIVETTIVPVKPLENDYPKAGIYFQGTDGVYHTVFVNTWDSLLVNSVNGTKNVSQYQLVTLNNYDGGWNQKALSEYNQDNPNATKKEGVKLTVVKYGGQFWYFVDGKYVTTEEYAFFDVSMIPGFYSLGADVIYKDYSCTTVKDTDQLKDYLNKHGLYYVEAKVTSAGGNVKSSVSTVKKGDSYDIKITTKPGYEVSSIVINGKEKYQDAKKKAVEGTYTVTGVKQNQLVEVKFEKVKGHIFSGTVKNADGLLDATITMYSQKNPLLCYEFTSSASKGFTGTLPAGTYSVKIEADNHMIYTGTLNLKNDLEKTYTLRLTEFPATVKVNDKEVKSSVDKWDLSQESKTKVSTSYSAGGKLAPLYFGKTGKDFVMQTTLNYTTEFVEGVDYQPDLMGGFMFSDGTKTGWILARKTGIVTTGFKLTSGLVGYEMLCYPTKKEATFAVAKKGEDLHFYINGQLLGTKKWSEVAPDVSADSELALGLAMLADKEADIEFSNYSVQVGTAAVTKYMKEHELKDNYVKGSSLFATELMVNGTKVRSMVDAWDVSDVAKNIVYGSHDMKTKLQPLYFAKSGKAAIMQTTIEYTTVIKDGVEYQPDLFGGFTFHDGTNSGWIMANRTGVAYTGFKFEQGLVADKVLALPEQRAVTVTAILYEDNVYILFDGDLVIKKKITSIVPGAKSGSDYAMGIMMHTDKTSDIRFSNTSITTDAKAAKDYIANNLTSKDAESSYNPIVKSYIEYARQLGKGQEIDGKGNVISTKKVTNATTIFIGDDTFDRKTAWTDFYTDDLKDKDAFLAGIANTRIQHWQELVDEVFAVFGNKSPKNIVINLGEHNINAGATATMTATGLQELFEQLHAKYPSAKIYYFGINYRYDKNNLNQTIKDTNNRVSAWCAKNDYITYIDTPSIITSSMLKDKIHPKLEYYYLFLDALKDAGCVISDK